MLTGLCPSKHGVDWNDYIPEKGIAQGVDLFDIAHAAGFQTVMHVGKEKLRQITDPSSLDIFTYVNDRDLVVAKRLIADFPENFGVMSEMFGAAAAEKSAARRRAAEYALPPPRKIRRGGAGH